jgi:hypothetical protein
VTFITTTTRVIAAATLITGIAAAVLAPPANASTGAVYHAGPTRGCGKVGGWTVAAGKTTTTCALARSAARDFLARVDYDRIDYGDASPLRITGYSAKRGRRYRLTNMDTTVTTSRMTASYEGRAGAATLLVRISARL